MKRTVDENGCMIGTYNDNPLLNTMVYDCEFPDGTTKECAANIIAENIYNNVDLVQDLSWIHRKCNCSLRGTRGTKPATNAPNKDNMANLGAMDKCEWIDEKK